MDNFPAVKNKHKFKLFIWNLHFESLREMCLNTEFFLVRIFPHSELTRRDTSYLSVFSPNAEKDRPEKTPYLDTFHTVNSPRDWNQIVIKLGTKHVIYQKLAKLSILAGFKVSFLACKCVLYRPVPKLTCN